MKKILTGGHSGIGLELTKMLRKEGHDIGMIIRSEKRKDEAIKDIGEADGIDFFYADLSKRGDIKRVAEEIKQKWGKIDGLFNNAGVLLGQDYYAESGNEMHFEINAIAPYLLTTELKSLLDASEAPFVINTATSSMNSQKKLDIPELKKPKKFVKLVGSYKQSKFALTLLMNQLAKEWPNVRIATVNPGPNKTKMTKESGMPGWLKHISAIMFPGPEKGAGLLYNAAFDSRYKDKSGVFISGGKIRDMSYQLSDTERVEMLT